MNIHESDVSVYKMAAFKRTMGRLRYIYIYFELTEPIRLNVAIL